MPTYSSSKSWAYFRYRRHHRSIENWLWFHYAQTRCGRRRFYWTPDRVLCLMNFNYHLGGGNTLTHSTFVGNVGPSFANPLTGLPELPYFPVCGRDIHLSLRSEPSWAFWGLRAYSFHVRTPPPACPPPTHPPTSQLKWKCKFCKTIRRFSHTYRFRFFFFFWNSMS